MSRYNDNYPDGINRRDYSNPQSPFYIESWYCEDCDENFPHEDAFDKHMREQHYEPQEAEE